MPPSDRSVPPTDPESTPDLVTKKFHLSQELKREIENRAESNYSGNASQLIRAAVRDHFSTLDGNGDRQIAHLKNEISSLQEKADRLIDIVQEEGEHPDSLEQQDGPVTGRVGSQSPATATESVRSDDGTLQREVYSALESADSNGLNLTELAECIDQPLSKVVKSAEELADRGVLQQQQDTETHRYLLNTEK